MTPIDTRALSAQKELTANDNRVLLAAMAHSKKVMSEYLNLSVNGNVSWLVQTLKHVFKLVERRMNKQPFQFKNTKEAAHHNTEILKAHGHDYTVLVKECKNKIL